MLKSENYFKTLIENVESNKDWLIELSSKIWSNPEIGHEEFMASKLLSEVLESNGFEVEREIAKMKTSFIGKYVSKKEGPTVAFIAEYDAIPNLGHACAHNLFCSSAVASAISLKSVIDEIGGTIVVLGSPAEEGVVPNYGGKAILINEGYFKDIDVAFTSHGENETVIERDLASSMSPEIVFHGYAVHAGGSPEKGINALSAGISCINNMNSVRQQDLPGDVVNAIIKEGGVVPNTIPDLCRLAFSLRSKTYKGLDRIWNNLKNSADSAAKVTGCTYELFPPNNIMKDTKSNHELGIAMSEILDKLHVPYKQHDSRNYAWDAGNVSYVVPTLASYFKIGGEEIICHTEEFKDAANSDEGYKGMIISGKSMAILACEYLCNKELRDRVAEEFKNTVR